MGLRNASYHRTFCRSACNVNAVRDVESFITIIAWSVSVSRMSAYSWFYEKGIYRTTFNSYVANTKRFANRNSLGMAPPLACHALTMVKFLMKNGHDGLHR